VGQTVGDRYDYVGGSFSGGSIAANLAGVTARASFEKGGTGIPPSLSLSDRLGKCARSSCSMCSEMARIRIFHSAAAGSPTTIYHPGGGSLTDTHLNEHNNVNYGVYFNNM
jgi:hypothetical protein